VTRYRTGPIQFAPAISLDEKRKGQYGNGGTTTHQVGVDILSGMDLTKLPATAN
jgi:hypothetical protein